MYNNNNNKKLLVLAGTLKFIRMWNYPFERKANSIFKTLYVMYQRVEGGGKGPGGSYDLLYVYSLDQPSSVQSIGLADLLGKKEKNHNTPTHILSLDS